MEEELINPEEVKATLLEIFKQKKNSGITLLLANAIAAIEFFKTEEWNDNSIDCYRLKLDIPPKLFAEYDSVIEKYEKAIEGVLRSLSEIEPGKYLGYVRICPKIVKLSKEPVAEDKLSKIWEKNKFRLFISHRSKYKVAVSTLKENWVLTLFWVIMRRPPPRLASTPSGSCRRQSRRCSSRRISCVP
jgi:hypothetical protein